MILGITGGISTGKTTVADFIAAAGVRVIDCDEVSRYLTAYDPQALSAIRGHFGDGVFHPAGALNRVALANIVFSAPADRRALEGILHPLIIAVVDANVQAARNRNESLAVVAPLLIEAGMTGSVDHLWVVACSEQNQIDRLCLRSSISAVEAKRWIGAQLPQSEKTKHADTIILNDGSIDDLHELVMRNWQALVKV